MFNYKMLKKYLLSLNMIEVPLGTNEQGSHHE